MVPWAALGEVGRNMTVYEINGKLLIVDCGVLFPEESQPGVDLIPARLQLHCRPSGRRGCHGADPRSRGPHRRGSLPLRRRPDIPWSVPN